MSLSASCTPQESESLHTGQSDSVENITSALENFILAVELSHKATIHLEEKLAVGASV